MIGDGSGNERRDYLMITFDALRYDVADGALRSGRTPFLQSLLPAGWELRHSPGSFTYASHAAFFAGFWPTCPPPRQTERPFALRFQGSRSVGAETVQFDNEDIVSGLREAGYRTICIGGVGFFNKRNRLGSHFPGLFDISDWSPEFGVGQVHSTRAQVETAQSRITEVPRDEPLFLFLNLSALHPPTHIYLASASCDTVDTQIAALEYVDRHLTPLFSSMRSRGRSGTAFLMSDHGTLFGEEGWEGHRVGHPTVWNVPYGEYKWEAKK